MVSLADEVERAAQLWRDGGLTDAEFASLKATLIARGAGATATPYPSPDNSGQHVVRQLAEYRKVSGIVWIVIGVLQICAILTAIAGVWNVLAGLSRLASAKAIERREPAVVAAAQGTTQLIVLAVVNVLLGAFIGLIGVALDFYVRDRILRNAHLFTADV